MPGKLLVKDRHFRADNIEFNPVRHKASQIGWASTRRTLQFTLKPCSYAEWSVLVLRNQLCPPYSWSRRFRTNFNETWDQTVIVYVQNGTHWGETLTGFTDCVTLLTHESLRRLPKRRHGVGQTRYSCGPCADGQLWHTGCMGYSMLYNTL